MIGEGKVVTGDKNIGVVGAQDALTVSQGLFVQVDGLLEFARIPVCGCEVVAGGEGVGVVGAQKVLSVSEVLHEQRNRLIDQASRYIGASHCVRSRQLIVF